MPSYQVFFNGTDYRPRSKTDVSVRTARMVLLHSTVESAAEANEKV
jgi:hypothetical protein